MSLSDCNFLDWDGSVYMKYCIKSPVQFKVLNFTSQTEFSQFSQDLAASIQLAGHEIILTNSLSYPMRKSSHLSSLDHKGVGPLPCRKKRRLVAARTPAKVGRG